MGKAGLEDRRGRRKKDQTPRTELEQAQIKIEQLKHKLYLAELENALLKKLDEIERRDASRKEGSTIFIERFRNVMRNRDFPLKPPANCFMWRVPLTTNGLPEN